jgi:hypothetical protein
MHALTIGRWDLGILLYCIGEHSIAACLVAQYPIALCYTASNYMRVCKARLSHFTRVKSRKRDRECVSAIHMNVTFSRRYAKPYNLLYNADNH